jgi:WD40 repeat protein
MWTMKVVSVFKGHTHRIKSVKWSLDDKKLYTCGLDGKLNIWNITTGKSEHVFQVSDQKFTSVACTDEKIQRVLTLTVEGGLYVMTYGVQQGIVVDSQVCMHIGKILKKIEWISSMNLLVACTLGDYFQLIASY